MKNRPRWIFITFIISLSIIIISSFSMVLLIKSKAKKENLAFPSQMANTLRSCFGSDFVAWLEVKLHKSNDFKRRFLYNLIGSKVKARSIETTANINPSASSTNTQNLSGAPENIQPYIQTNPIPNEGKWEFEKLPKINGQPIIYHTVLRIDEKRPYAIVDIASIDISKVNFHLVAGSKYRGKTGKGTGLIYYLDRPKLVASMNGGFLPVHKTGGMIIDGEVFLRMVSGKATFIMYKDGSVEIKVWKRSMKNLLPKIKHARQNLNILLQNGKFNRRNKNWGIVKPGEDATYNWRSGLGISRDGKRLIYIAGNDISPKTLARAFVLAGCDTAMHMDMNVSNIAFNYYRHRDGDVEALSLSQRFWQHMTGTYLRGYTHDFIYMTRR